MVYTGRQQTGSQLQPHRWRLFRFSFLTKKSCASSIKAKLLLYQSRSFWISITFNSINRLTPCLFRGFTTWVPFSSQWESKPINSHSVAWGPSDWLCVLCVCGTGVLLISLALCADAAIGNVQEKAMKLHNGSNSEMVTSAHLRLKHAHTVLLSLLLHHLPAPTTHLQGGAPVHRHKGSACTLIHKSENLIYFTEKWTEENLYRNFQKCKRSSAQVTTHLLVYEQTERKPPLFAVGDWRG